MLIILKHTDMLVSKYGKVFPLLSCGNSINILNGRDLFL